MAGRHPANQRRPVDSRSGYPPALWVWSPVGVHRKTSLIHQCFSASLSPSLLLSVKTININLKCESEHFTPLIETFHEKSQGPQTTHSHWICTPTLQSPGGPRPPPRHPVRSLGLCTCCFLSGVLFLPPPCPLQLSSAMLIKCSPPQPP